MRCVHRISVVVTLLLIPSGCAAPGQARYVYQDGQYGVVGIPENTDRWPSHYREKADGLMAQHFPDGFEIVRAEEVVEGSRTLTLNGTNSAQVEAATVVPFLKLGKIGRTASTTRADSVKIKECRILYKKAGSEDLDSEAGFAALSTLSPAPYIDPNAESRTYVVAKPKPEPAVDTLKLAEKAAEDGAKAHEKACEGDVVKAAHASKE